jgi:hypothetical protein
MVIRDLLPAGLIGLLMAAFLAAYMSTLASQTVWGTSYIINDLFRPYIKPGADEKYYVKVSRITTFLLIFLSLIVTTQFTRISDAWKFILACSGGIGLVLIFRWFWWRINAWSEISAMLAPYVIYPFLKARGMNYETILMIIVVWSTVVWVVVTLLTKPTSPDQLKAFYIRVHPGGRGWRKIAGELPDIQSDRGFTYLFINWFAGCCMVLSLLFGLGRLIFDPFWSSVPYLLVGLACAAIIYLNMKKMGWEKVIR